MGARQARKLISESLHAVSCFHTKQTRTLRPKARQSSACTMICKALGARIHYPILRAGESSSWRSVFSTIQKSMKNKTTVLLAFAYDQGLSKHCRYTHSSCEWVFITVPSSFRVQRMREAQTQRARFRFKARSHLGRTRAFKARQTRKRVWGREGRVAF